MARSGGKAMSSENGWIRWEGQCQVRMARSDGKGYVKSEWLGQVAMSSEKGWVRWEGQCQVRMARSGGKGNVK